MVEVSVFEAGLLLVLEAGWLGVVAELPVSDADAGRVPEGEMGRLTLGEMGRTLCALAARATASSERRWDAFIAHRAPNDAIKETCDCDCHVSTPEAVPKFRWSPPFLRSHTLVWMPLTSAPFDRPLSAPTPTPQKRKEKSRLANERSS